MEELRVLLIQLNIVWHDPEANMQKAEQLIQDKNPNQHLIVLPEMFTTGFSMHPEKYAVEHKNNAALIWMQGIATKFDSVVAGSIMVEDSDQYYNRMYVVQPEGHFDIYDKKHLFSFANEDKHYSAGKDRLIVEVFGWKVACFICYDLRFPEWCRNELSNPYDVSVFVANWPDKRNFAWENLLEARAIENQSYVLGVNRTGTDGKGLHYSGHSLIINYEGKRERESIVEETVISHVLSRSALDNYRKVFPFLKDQYE